MRENLIMEWIGVGIAIAIGFYLAPVVVMFVLGALAIVGVGVCRFFGGCRDM